MRQITFFDTSPSLSKSNRQPETISGFATRPAEYLLEIDFPETLLAKVPEDQRESLIAVLAHDPRPQYQNNPERIYGMTFGAVEVKFRVEEMTLKVQDICPIT